MENEAKHYVFNEVEDVQKLNENELRSYVCELQQRLADEKKNTSMLRDWWYEEKNKIENIKADVESLKKITNLMVEKW